MKFYQLTPLQRREILKQSGINLNKINDSVLNKLNLLSENVVGQLRLPLSVVENVIINKKKFWVPMAIEEPSVVAAANHGCEIFAKNGGVKSISERNGIYGQIVLKIGREFSLNGLKKQIPYLIIKTNKKYSSLVQHGGGLKDIRAHLKNDLLYLKVLVDPAEAMGANKTNSILEYLSDHLVLLKGIKEKLFAILSNYPSQLTTAKVQLDFSSIRGIKVAKKIQLLSKLGRDDPYRAVTNNKGIMNGVDAVLLATGNDFRGVEAASAVWANKTGHYTSLSNWKIKNNKLVGEITLPLAIGTVGGSINARTDVKQSYLILGNDINSATLANLIATIGLANNLAALLAISTKGIQAGHMKLQARNIVSALVDATDNEKEMVLHEMIAKKEFSQSASRKILTKIRKKK